MTPTIKPGIDPVIQMAGPAGEEFDHAGEFIGVGLGQERLLGEEVGRTRAGIQLGQFGVTDGGRKAQHQRREKAEPHAEACHGRAVECLLLKCEPRERRQAQSAPSR